jgi:regulator of protease activity HflC (stomatin/prohibitin superfamily)
MAEHDHNHNGSENHEPEQSPEKPAEPGREQEPEQAGEPVQNLAPQGHEHPEPPDAIVPEPEPEEEDLELGNQALADALRISFNWLKFAMIVLVVVYLLMGIFWAGQDEMKFKMRFGEVVSGPITPATGVRVRMPWEKVVTISTSKQDVHIRPHEVPEGQRPAPTHFWPLSASPNQQMLRVKEDGYLITGDRNIVHMLLRVRYRVGHGEAATRRGEAARHFYFLVGPENAGELLTGLAMSAATRVVATMTVDNVLREKALLSSRMQTELEQEIDQLEKSLGVDSIGIVVEEGDIDFLTRIGERTVRKNPREPFPTQKAFDRHQEANSEASKLRQEGQAEAQRIVRRAEASAENILQQADSDAERIMSRVEADLTVLQSLLESIYGKEEYQAPYPGENGDWVVPPLPPHTAETRRKEQVMRQRHYMRAIEQVLRAAAAAFVLREPREGDDREIWLDLQRPLQGAGGRQGPAGGMR